MLQSVLDQPWLLLFAARYCVYGHLLFLLLQVSCLSLAICAFRHISGSVTGLLGVPYLLEYTPRRLFHFFAIQLRRLFEGGVYSGGGVCSKITLKTLLKRTLKTNFVHESLERKREKSACSTSEVSVLTAELRVAKFLERELINIRAKKYSHFELKNIVLKENKFPLLV